MSVVDRGGHRQFLVMRNIASFRGEWFGVSELADKVNLPRPTTHARLKELVAQGVVEYKKGKYRSRYATISLLVTVESITTRLQEQGIEPSADVLACAIAQMREAASIAAADALEDFIEDFTEYIA